MRILLIGANGQLGRALSQAFSNSGELIEADVAARAGQRQVDLSDPASTVSGLNEVTPAVVLIAGALTHVDLCETERERCRRINADGPGVVAAWARERGARVVFYSTDQVFDGTKDSYRETDPVSPLNYYARCKVDAERRLAELLPGRHLILRTAWLYGPDPARKNFALRLVQRLRAGERVPVPSDQWGTPTYTDDLAGLTRTLVAQGRSGLVHAVGPELIDRLTLARAICTRFAVDARQLLPIRTSDLKQPALRPLRVHLDCGQMQALGAGPFRAVQAGLDSLYAWDQSA